jgi:hypothetical protein
MLAGRRRHPFNRISRPPLGKCRKTPRPLPIIVEQANICCGLNSRFTALSMSALSKHRNSADIAE